MVGGRHTESGSPILAADSHLEPTVPALLHLSHVQGDHFNVAGVAVPGVPIFWTGHNRRVAWASTHARAASIDLYYEALGETDSSQYHDGKRWRPLKERIERIAVRGNDPEMLTVRTTKHGPLIHELLGVDEPLSLAWVGARADINSGWVSMSRLAASRNNGELLGALASHHEPLVAFAYADRRGGGGVQVAGWFPVKVLPANLVPLPGRASWYDWTGHVAFNRLPAQKLRAGRGWAIVADNALADLGRTKEIDWLWRSGARAGRIKALLNQAVEGGKIDLREMSELQSDVGSMRVLSVITKVLDAAGPVESLSVEAREIAQLLVSWDGSSEADSVGASVYYVFLECLSAGLFTHVLGEDLAERYRALPQVDITETILALIAAGDSDKDESAIDLESVREVTRRSLRQTWLELSFRLGANRGKWRWGRLHELSFQPFGSWRTGLDLEGLEGLPYGGGGSTVNTAEFIGPESLQVRVASTFRIVVNVGSPDQALAALAPGESEHPGHLHYRDGLEGWLGGRSELLVTDPLLVKESGALQLILEPAP